MMFGKKVLVAMEDQAFEKVNEKAPTDLRVKKIMQGKSIAMSSFGKILVQVDDLAMTVQPEDIFFYGLADPSEWSLSIVSDNADLRGVSIEDDEGYDCVASETMGSQLKYDIENGVLA